MCGKRGVPTLARPTLRYTPYKYAFTYVPADVHKHVRLHTRVHVHVHPNVPATVHTDIYTNFTEQLM